jgi:hypothetical protein
MYYKPKEIDISLNPPVPVSIMSLEEVSEKVYSCPCQAPEQQIARRQDVEDVKSFAEKLVNHTEYRVEPSQVQEVIKSAKNIEGNCDNFFNEGWEDAHASELKGVSAIRYQKKITLKGPGAVPRGLDHMILGLVVEPESTVKVSSNGWRFIEADSGADGIITFDQPILLISLSYNEVSLEITGKDGRVISECILDVITLIDKQLINDFGWFSSKNIPWTMHKSMKEPICYYRGMLVSWSARGWAF